MKRRPTWLGALLLALAATAVLLAVAAGGPGRAGSAPTFGRGTLTITQGSKRIVLNVEIANTMATRSYGLMFRRSLPDDAGMLFMFEEDAQGGFWMKNTLIPLSIGFVDSKWYLIDIQDMAVAADPATGPFPTYGPSKPYRYALEVNQGFFQRKGIATGARLELTTAR